MAGRRTARRDPGSREVWLILLLAAAIALRASGSPTVTALRETVREVITRDADYVEAVAVVGRAAAGEQDNAVLVFGSKLLGAGKLLGEAMLT